MGSGLKLPERKKIKLGYKIPMNDRGEDEIPQDTSANESDSAAFKVPVKSLPEYVNWFERGFVTRPYGQGSCGACWAFTAAATLEALAKQKGVDKNLLEYSV